MELWIINNPITINMALLTELGRPLKFHQASKVLKLKAMPL